MYNQGIETPELENEQHPRDRWTHPTRLARALTGLSISVTLLVLLVVATELAATVARPKILQYRAGPGDRRGRMKFYEKKPWANKYWKEDDAATRFQLRPYVFWRRRAFRGQYINVDEEGIRLTANPDCTPEAPRIWMFGGSNVWGTGAKDDETIPSILAHEYSKSLGPVCVTNFGEAGWVSTQDIIQLEIALKRTHKPPDFVVFYDGIGDVQGIYQSGRVDLPNEFEKVREKVEVSGEETEMSYLRETNTYRLFGIIMTKLLNLKQMSAQPGSKPGRDVTLYAPATADNYLKNLMLLDTLSARYGFRHETFWGPLAYLGNKPLVADEQKERDEFERAYPGLPALAKKTHDLVFSTPNRHVHDLANAFDNRPEELFVDYGHTNPVGNQIVARRILETISKPDSQPRLTH
jgi:lysophospholipase L1-like esterase